MKPSNEIDENFTLLIVLITSFAACKKSSSNKSKIELLTEKAWLQTNSEEKSGTNNWSADPMWASIKPCDKDNNLVFKTDGTLEVNEGPTKCATSGSQIVGVLTWSLDNNENSMNITSFQGSSTFETSHYTIDQLDENILELEMKKYIDTTITTFRYTLAH